MIKFFRHIRQNLIMKNHSDKPTSASGMSGKYVKYAIGEIILVVIGILIALQINNWNQNRLNRTIEKETLYSLKQDLDSAMIQLNVKIRQNERFRLFDSTAMELIHHRTEVPQDSLYKLLLSHIFTPTFDPELGTLNEILNTGKMEIIQDKLLRSHISSWNRYMDELSEVDERLIYLDDHFKTPLYMKLLPYRDALNYVYNPNSNQPLYRPMENSNFETSLETTLYSLEFESLLSNYLIYGNIQRERMGDIQNKITKMVTLIEADLSHD